ncbi:MAG: type II toxin-antitoxin system VapC family toxin [Caldilineaceae bacterium]
MSRPISAIDSSQIYLDTNTFYLLLRAVTPQANELFGEIEQGGLYAYTSALTFDELAYRLLLALIRDVYGRSPLDRLRQNKSEMVAAFSSKVDDLLAEMIGYPHLTIVSVDAKDILAMRQNIKHFRLMPRDALHLAAMQKVGCFHLISQDSDFDHIPGITRYTLD